MIKHLIPAFRMALILTALTGLIYPIAVTGLCQVLFPKRAHGSLITQNGKVIGSALIGQNFTTAKYFHPRPSAAGNNGYDATASGGSNLGPTNRKLRDRVAGDVDRLRKDNPDAPLPIPAELVTTSASGLDPELSPQAALWQVSRIAHARQVAPG